MIFRNRKIIIIALAFCAMLGTPSSIKAIPPSLYADMTGGELQNHLGNIKHKKLVMIFASWCPSCRLDMPQVLNLTQLWTGAFIPVSIDQNRRQLGSYISSLYKIPQMVIRATTDIRHPLSHLGINYKGRIPYYAVLNTDGTVLAQGNIPLTQLKELLLAAQ